jgi:hypothetical protein
MTEITDPQESIIKRNQAFSMASVRLTDVRLKVKR